MNEGKMTSSQIAKAIELKIYSAPSFGVWFTLEQAYLFKFGTLGPALSTLKNNTALQPRAGVPDDWQQGKRVWNRETVDEWSLVTDSTLSVYLAKVAPGRKIPDFIKSSNSKRSNITTKDIKRARKAKGGAA